MLIGGKLVVEHMGTLSITYSIVQLRSGLPNVIHNDCAKLLTQNQTPPFSLSMHMVIPAVVIISDMTAG